MGTAIRALNSTFSTNLGQITPLQDIPVTAIEIAMNASYSGTTFTPSITYTPTNSNKKGVTWSITAGGTYATINATTGVVTILSTANASSITIQAVSNYDSSIVATATTAVTYVEQVIDVTSVTITGNSTMSLTGTLTAAILPSNATAQTVTWAVTSGADLVTITTNGNTANFVIKGTGNITVTATAGGVTATKTIAVSDTISTDTVINFEDTVVKNICVTNFDLNSDGECTYGELKTVTSAQVLGKFTGAAIVNFDEFKYFEGITSLGFDHQMSDFMGNTTLKKITLPKKITTISTGFFKNCTALETVTFPSDSVITSLGNDFFNGCTHLAKVVLPNSITTINNGFSYNCPALKVIDVGTGITTIGTLSSGTTGAMKMIIRATTPPSILSYGCGNIDFYVPDSAYDTYLATGNWASTYSAKIHKLSTYVE